MNRFTLWMVAAGLSLSSMEMCAKNDSTDASSKRESKNLAVYMEMLGSAFCYSSLHAELIFVNDERSSMVESYRVSAGIGLGAIQNAYAPILGKIVLLQGSGHIEFGLGVNILTAYSNPQPGSFLNKDLSHSDFNLISVIGYRYEQPGGGFVFRVDVTPMYDFGARKLVSMGGFSLGWSW
jgi:hypothetical protein